MALPDEYAVTVDGFRIGDYAAMVEEFTGLVGVAAWRGTAQSALARHGAIPRGRTWSAPRTRTLGITLFDTNKDGDRNHPYGSVGQWQANVDDLLAIFGKQGLIDYKRTILTATGPVVCQGSARVLRTIDPTGSTSATRMAVQLEFDWPWLHELPKVTLAADTSHTIATGGTAPIADMVFTFTGDGTLTDNQGHTITVTGSTGPVTVDVGKREVRSGGQLALGLLGTTGLKEWWCEWPARTNVTLSSDVAVGVEFHRARH